MFEYAPASGFASIVTRC